MNKHKRYLPSLLALSIATALGSGTFVFASWATATDVQSERQQTTLRSSFSTLMQQTLRKAQEPTLRSSFSTLMQQSLRKAREAKQRSEPATMQAQHSRSYAESKTQTTATRSIDWSKRHDRYASSPSNRLIQSQPEQAMAEYDDAGSPDMELISSISMPDEESTAEWEDNNASVTEEELALEGDTITYITAPAPRPTQSRIVGANLLAHQGMRISVPTVVTSPRHAGVAPQLQTQTQAQAQIRQQPLPRKWLPDLEVTPRERLAKVRPQAPVSTPAPTLQYTMEQTMPRQSATLERWQYAPKNTRQPNTYQRPQLPAVTSVEPNQIQRPSRQSMPPQQVISRPQKNVPGAVRNWSLQSDATITNTAPPPVADPISIPAPNPVPVLEREPWPEPQYTANNRLAPELPSFSEQPTWQGASSLKTRIQHKRQSLSEYRRPPPVMPKDIYQLASAQEPPAAAYHSDKLSKEESAPRSDIHQYDLQRSNSVDRFRQYVREPLTPVEQPSSNQPSNNQLSNNQPSNKQQLRYASQKTETGQASLRQMLNASTNSLSIQWAVSTDLAVIQKLQQRYPALNNATVVRFKSIGEAWYLLLTGIYPDRSSAKRALESPEYQAMAKQLTPWMRPLDGLKSLKLVAENGQPLKPSMQAQQSNQQKVLPQGEYTIQWMESGNHQQLFEMRNRYAQLANAEIIMVSRNQGMHYFLIQGRFAGFQSVENALLAPRFSSLVHQLSPKPRPMASLHHNTQTIQPTTSKASPSEEIKDASGKDRPWS